MKYDFIKNKLTTFVLLAAYNKMLTGSEAADDSEESQCGFVPAAVPLRGIVELELTEGESQPKGGGRGGLISHPCAFSNHMSEPGCLHILCKIFLQVFKSSPHVKT